jgi:hypothetical protein
MALLPPWNAAQPPVHTIAQPKVVWLPLFDRNLLNLTAG